MIVVRSDMPLVGFGMRSPAYRLALVGHGLRLPVSGLPFVGSGVPFTGLGVRLPRVSFDGGWALSVVAGPLFPLVAGCGLLSSRLCVQLPSVLHTLLAVPVPCIHVV